MKSTCVATDRENRYAKLRNKTRFKKFQRGNSCNNYEAFGLFSGIDNFRR